MFEHKYLYGKMIIKRCVNNTFCIEIYHMYVNNNNIYYIYIYTIIIKCKNLDISFFPIYYVYRFK